MARRLLALAAAICFAAATFDVNASVPLVPLGLALYAVRAV